MSTNQDQETPLSGNADFDSGLRLGLLKQLGESGFDSPGADRDRYDVFGWEKDPDKEEYFGLYLRNPYAHAIIDRPASVTWRDTPSIEDDNLQDAFLSLERQHDLTQYFNRADRAAGPGEYSLLFIDFDDTQDPTQLSQPYNPDDADLDSIRGHRVFTQLQVENVEYGDFGSDHWGEPERYNIDLTDDVDDDSDLSGSIQVHASRVVTIPSTRLFDDETKSRPRLEPVLNPLYDIEKTLGSAAEQSYRGADYGLHLNADPTEVDGTNDSFDQLGEEVQKWYHGLQPWLRTQGVDVERLGGDIQDPSALIGSELDAISAQTGIPKRVLTGDAQGELAASEEDTNRWYGHIRSRQQQYAEPLILRRYVDKLISHGVFDQPDDGFYEVSWPDLFEKTEQEIADTENTRSATVQQLARVAPGIARDLVTEGYIETGEFPDDFDDGQVEAVEDVDANTGRDWFSERFDLSENQGADVDLTPPEAAQENAQKVLRWREEHPDEIQGMTDVGWRRARQLADGGELSPGVVKKMAQFKRHQKNAPVDEEHKGTPWRDAGHVAWLGWGGDAGVNWAVRQSEKLSSNATRYEEGDTVDTPDGLGVVVEVRTESFTGPDDSEVSASEDSPAYVVGVEDERVGAAVYRASDLSMSEFPEGTPENPEEDLGEMEANAVERALRSIFSANQETTFGIPDSWQESETPNRIILLKAWAGLGGRFTSCVREMRGEITGSPDRFCASMKDRVLQWEGWRQGG